MVQIAIIGDVHTAFDSADVAYFNQSDYDLMLFVGDLARYRFREGVQTAKVMAQLEKTAVYVPGNHDSVTALQMLAEIKQWQWLKRLTSIWHPWRVRKLDRAMGAVLFGGYKTFSFELNGLPLDIVTGRPFTWGENLFANPHYLKKQYGVDSPDTSVAKLKQCVDDAKSENLIFLAHTGPFGLGNGRADIWGIDYKKGEGDNGDHDLQQAVAYAKSQGKNVLALFAGHMHRCLKRGGERNYYVVQDETHYVNAAQVPRIVEENGRKIHHYVKLAIDNQTITITESHHQT